MGQIIGAMFVNKGPEIDLDLEGEHPDPEEAHLKIYKRVNDLLSRHTEALNLVDGYRGCQDLARKAMSEPSNENEQKAFEGLLVAVDSIAVFFKFVAELEEIFPEFILAIASHYNITPGNGESLQENVPQALCKQLVQLVDFAIKFDQIRMLRPNLSNDFSYYRRLLPKFNKHPNIKIKDSEASGMALFTAHHIPMVNGLTKACVVASAKNENVAMVLAMLGNSCLKGIREGRWDSNKDLKLTAARAMAGAVVLYDQCCLVDEKEDGVNKAAGTMPKNRKVHAFNKKAPVKTKEIIQMLKKEFSMEVALLNAIHFSTAHFAEAPPHIVNLFE